MTNALIQAAIAVLSLSAIWLSQTRRKDWQRYACLFGLASQPFWLYSTFMSDQWGMFVLSILYTVVWGAGFHLHWIMGGSK